MLKKPNLSIQLLAMINACLIVKDLTLKTGSIFDGTLNTAPSLTKNTLRERDSEMHQIKTGNQWHFGMKADIGVVAD